MKKLFGIFVLVLTINHSVFAVDFDQIEKGLKTGGVVGWVHAAVESQGMYVFTYRNPENFFDYVQMSLVSQDPKIMNELAKCSRHDKVKVKGSFLDNPSPQKHIDVTSIEMIEKFTSGYPSDSYDRAVSLPEDLLGKTSANFLVHAVAEGGQILVVEYKDTIIPVFVRNGELSKNIFRNDIVTLNFRIQREPNQPVHLRINEAAAEPIKVLQSIRALQGKEGFIEGALVMFPKSPEIIFNVFAVEEKLVDGLSRQYTIVNFDSNDLFTQARIKLQTKWDLHPGEYINGRNKLISTKIKVRVSGTFSNPVANQANPQILIHSLDDVQILE